MVFPVGGLQLLAEIFFVWECFLLLSLPQNDAAMSLMGTRWSLVRSGKHGVRGIALRIYVLRPRAYATEFCGANPSASVC